MSILKVRRRTLIVWISVLVALAITTAASAIYLGSYYRADDGAIADFMPNGCEWRVEDDGDIVIMPDGATQGLIFYPGGKVEHEAYIPLMQACAKEGIACVIVSMPFRLAVLDMNAADGVLAEFPEIENWYIGGHSLGGAMAASYVDSHAEEFEGLILLGAYSTADLTDTSLEVLSVYGSEDGVMDREKYADCLSNIAGATEIVIEGGCHAYFGMYGEQDGDGSPTLTPKEQIEITAAAITAIMNPEN